jgi:hypothetical protein
MTVRIFKNRALRKIFGRKREEISGDCRKRHIERLRDLYSSSNIIRVIK